MNGSVSLDGSTNVTLSAQVVNDSHNHDGRYYTESEANSRFLESSGDTQTGHINFNGEVGAAEDKAYVEFYVHGSSESTYYPVVIGGAAEGYGYKDYSISRRYNWTAPTSWNTSTHKGGLTLTWQHSSDTAWGGNDKEWRVIQFDETYSQVCQGLILAVTGGMVVWLRGGGSGGARYRLHSPRGRQAPVTIYDGTTSGTSGQGTHNSSTSFTASNGTVYSAETANTTTRDNRIKPRWPVRDRSSLFSGGDYAVWTPANDGTGTGLDADTLDGLQGDFYFKSQTNDNGGWSQSNRNFSVRTGGSAVGLHMEESNGTFGLQLYGDGSHYGFLDGEWAGWDIQKTINGAFSVDEGSGLKRVLNEANWSSYISIPTSLPANGGNADTVDSLQASQFLRSDTSDTMGGELNVSHNGGATGTAAPTYSQANIELQTSSNHAPAIGFHRGGYSATTLYENNGELYVNPWVTRAQAGKLISSGNYDDYVTAAYINGLSINADTLDGEQGSYYFSPVNFPNRTNFENTFNNLSSSTGGNADLNTTFANDRSGFFDVWGGVAGSNNKPPGTTHVQGVQVRHQTGNDYGWQLASQYNQPGKMYLRHISNGTFYDWHTMWTSQNDGAGSGLDADTLDSMQPKNSSGTTGADQILRSHSNNYFYHASWIQVGSSGLFSTSTNGAHFSPNNVTSYATWKTSGARGGYDGIMFDSGGDVAIMYDSAGNGGLYREPNGRWHIYHHVANNCLGIGGSTTSSAYSTYVSGALYATGNITAYSDRRVKENIVTLDSASALDKVNALRGVYYNRIDDPEKTKQIGFIAQEVNEVVPELVTYAEDVDQYGVNYGNATALLVEAVKDLTQQVKDLKAEIEEMKNV